MGNLCLASASPRRRELLALLPVPFVVKPAHIDETPHPSERPEDYVCRMAVEKAQVVQIEGWVLGADTSVVLDGTIMGKPQSKADGCRMLQSLSGRTHQVMTAVCLRGPDGNLQTELVVTAVTFTDLLANDIAAYWATGEPADKAGAYGIQGLGARFVTRIEGSYHAVVGLPLDVTARLLARAGFDLWSGSRE